MVKPSTETPSRVFIACSRCKARKRKCNGQTPRCSNCVLHNAECIYAAERRTRGPGKKLESDERGGNAPYGTNQTLHDVSLAITDAAGLRPTNKPPLACLPLIHMNQKPLTIFPLLSEVNPQNIGVFKTKIDDAISRGGYSPLMPLQFSRHLVQESFTEIIPDTQFISLESVIELLESQYADDMTGPGQNAARWAVVNCVIALAGRFKTAAGSEAYMSPITLSFYRNASLVISQLILDKPSVLSVQAFLCMAIFARGIPDMDAFLMLASNACNQLEILRRAWISGHSAMPLLDNEEFGRVCWFASQLSLEARHVMLPCI